MTSTGSFSWAKLVVQAPTNETKALKMRAAAAFILAS